MVTKEYVKLKLDELHPYENNPRINDEAVKHVVASIEQCENLDPIEVDEDNVILSGHTRLLALQELGYTETECIRYSGLLRSRRRNTDCLQTRQTKLLNGILINSQKNLKNLISAILTLDLT